MSKDACVRAFVSGHTYLTQEQFLQYYKEKLDKAIAKSHCFLLGNAKGADTMALEYLLQNGVDPSRITVYHFRRDGNLDQLQELKALKVNYLSNAWPSYSKRDAEMTRMSDYDIAYVLIEQEQRAALGTEYNARIKSGTQRNLERRKRMRS